MLHPPQLPINPPDPAAVQPTQLCLRQAPVAKKQARRPPKEEKSEAVEPQSVADKIKALLEDALKESGSARTSAIQLKGLDYAQHLHTAIKDHADKFETLYSEVQGALKGGVDDAKLENYVKQIEAKSEATKKFQAQPAEFLTHASK